MSLMVLVLLPKFGLPNAVSRSSCMAFHWITWRSKQVSGWVMLWGRLWRLMFRKEGLRGGLICVSGFVWTLQSQFREAVWLRFNPLASCGFLSNMKGYRGCVFSVACWVIRREIVLLVYVVVVRVQLSPNSMGHGFMRRQGRPKLFGGLNPNLKLGPFSLFFY